jgi:hypothetical protein
VYCLRRRWGRCGWGVTSAAIAALLVGQVAVPDPRPWRDVLPQPSALDLAADPAGRQLAVRAAMVAPVCRDFDELLRGARITPSRQALLSSASPLASIIFETRDDAGGTQRAHAWVWVGADEQQALAYAATRTLAPTVPSDWDWAGKPVGDVAFGWQAERVPTLVVVHGCFCGVWVRAALSHIRVERPDLVLESACRAWIARCDAALAWADADHHDIEVAPLGAVLAGRTVHGVSVVPVAALAETAGAEIRPEESGEVIAVVKGHRVVRLPVGLAKAESAGVTVDLGFPTLQVADDLSVCDADAVARLLTGAGEGPP